MLFLSLDHSAVHARINLSVHLYESAERLSECPLDQVVLVSWRQRFFHQTRVTLPERCRSLVGKVV